MIGWIASLELQRYHLHSKARERPSCSMTTIISGSTVYQQDLLNRSFLALTCLEIEAPFLMNREDSSYKVMIGEVSAKNRGKYLEFSPDSH